MGAHTWTTSQDTPLVAGAGSGTHVTEDLAYNALRPRAWATLRGLRAGPRHHRERGQPAGLLERRSPRPHPVTALLDRHAALPFAQTRAWRAGRLRHGWHLCNRLEVHATGFEPVKHEATDLEPVPVGRLGTRAVGSPTPMGYKYVQPTVLVRAALLTGRCMKGLAPWTLP